MADHQKLEQTLERISGQGYKAYKAIKGVYRFPEFILYIDHVQGDPFAAPSRIRVRVDRNASGLSRKLTQNKSRQIAACDYLTRVFYKNCRRYSRGGRGTGKSGLITVDRPGQEMLETTAVIMDDQLVEARIFMGLPASGRRISGRDAAVMFLKELPEIVQQSLFLKGLDPVNLRTHVDVAEDADALRHRLDGFDLIGFVADDALLPRASGIDPAPMAADRAVQFQSPGSLKILFQSFASIEN